MLSRTTLENNRQNPLFSTEVLCSSLEVYIAFMVLIIVYFICYFLPLFWKLAAQPKYVWKVNKRV